MRVGTQDGRVGGIPMGDVFHSDCAGRVVLDHITSRWATLILAALGEGSMRFFELRTKIGGISEKMLSQNLRILVRDGLIERTVEPATPPKVSYQLTTLGSGLTAALQHLVGWIAQHTAEIVAAQDLHDQRSPDRPAVSPKARYRIDVDGP